VQEQKTASLRSAGNRVGVGEVLLYRFIPKIAILSTCGCFLALFGPSRGEKGQKKGKQTNS